MIIEDIEQTNKKYEEFYQSEGGFDISAMANIENLIYLGAIAHKNIRKIIGGVEKTVSFDFTPSALTDGELDHIIYVNILGLIGTYHTISVDMIKPIIKEKYYIDKNGRQVKSFGALVDFLRSKNIPQRYIDSIEKNFGVYAESAWVDTSRKFELQFTIATDLLSFAKIGHNTGVDTNACFNSSKDRCVDKYKLYLTKDSYVAYIKHNNEVLARFWGILNNEMLVYTNMYVNDKIIKRKDIGSIVIDLMKNTFEHAKSFNPDDNLRYRIRNILSSIYINSDTICYGLQDPKQKTKNHEQNIVPPLYGSARSLRPQRCTICNKILTLKTKNTAIVDDGYAHLDCYQKNSDKIVRDALTSGYLFKNYIKLYGDKYVSAKTEKQYDKSHIVRCCLTGEKVLRSESSDLMIDGKISKVATLELNKRGGFKLNDKGYYEKMDNS